ncbi:hypothetical protein ATY30_12490 [Sinorhizobium americanum]|nr:hypothetical protein CO664_08915 [Sinorhizobium sp. NG07B]POH32195.1 hypothetical protein ATY30_12490 [Sinorhizobium americanum]
MSLDLLGAEGLTLNFENPHGMIVGHVCERSKRYRLTADRGLANGLLIQPLDLVTGRPKQVATDAFGSAEPRLSVPVYKL